MSLKYTCPSCGTPLGYEGLCWKCKCEQERQAALAWMPEQIVEKQRNLIQNIQRQIVKDFLIKFTKKVPEAPYGS